MDIKNKLNKFKEFALTTAAVKNRKSVYLILTMIIIGGISAYQSMPREAFPEIQVPNIFVSIPYPGNSPDIIEDKIIKPFEKELNTIVGIDKIKATAMQDFALIVVEFDFEVKPDDAKKKVEDALTDARASKDFAQDLPVNPSVAKMDVNEMPILNINISGNYPVQYLKDKAEYLKDKIESLSEINKADIRGVQEQKLKIAIRKFDAEARGVSYRDIEGAIRNDNITMGAGNLKIDGIDHFVMLDNKFKSADELLDLIVKHEGTNDVRLYEIADVSFGDADTTSFARQEGNPVVMIDVKKRSGVNIIEAVNKVKKIVNDAWGTEIPKKSISITLTNDFSSKISSQVSNLENSIIFGVLLVVGVLLFFLGLRNALYVGIAIPLSMFMSFLLLNMVGVTLNVMVLFSLVLALGMLVDNGIVVIENIYRLMEEEGFTPMQASIKGVGEVAWPIIASTATTLAAFIPLALWPGIMGEFMFYLPVTLMIVLGSSLFVALVINPVLTTVSMKLEQTAPKPMRVFIYAAVLVGIAVMGFMAKNNSIGNLGIVAALFVVLNAFVLIPLAIGFQNKVLPLLEGAYKATLGFLMKGKRPYLTVFMSFVVLVASFALVAIFPPKIEFFPINQPNYFNVFISHPKGTDIHITNETSKEVATIINRVLEEKGYRDVFDVTSVKQEDGSILQDTIPLVSSIIEQVGKGTSDDKIGPAGGDTPHKAKITVTFCEFSHRKGVNTSQVLKEVEDALRSWPFADVSINIAKEQNGPPQEPPVNIEIRGSSDYSKLVVIAEQIRHYLFAEKIEGIQEVQANVKADKAEIHIELDRAYLRASGMSSGQVASAIRTSLFGKDISTFEIKDDSYDINMRAGHEFRGNIDALLDQKISFMNNRGQKMNIPIRSVVKDISTVYNNSTIERLNLENVVTVYSEVMEGYNANEIVDVVKEKMEAFDETPYGKELKEMGISYKFTGKLEQQNKEMAFLSKALLVAIFLILLIIVAQFNSFSTPIIILSAVVLSLAGVFLGIVISQDLFVIMMTMIGIISLAGIVVNNAIVLVDYTNLTLERRKAALGLSESEKLPIEEVKNGIIHAGKTRLRPVLLTAITTVLGLFPLAIGMNINFFTLFSDYDAQIFFGGDNALFFGPMSWAIIYGLSFATFLTLLVVPSMYYMMYRIKGALVKKEVV